MSIENLLIKKHTNADRAKLSKDMIVLALEMLNEPQYPEDAPVQEVEVILRAVIEVLSDVN